MVCILNFFRESLVCVLIFRPSLLAIVFPTLWEYLQSLGVAPSQTFYLGLCVAGKIKWSDLGLQFCQQHQLRECRSRSVIFITATALLEKKKDYMITLNFAYNIQVSFQLYPSPIFLRACWLGG